MFLLAVTEYRLLAMLCPCEKDGQIDKVGVFGMARLNQWSRPCSFGDQTLRTVSCLRWLNNLEKSWINLPSCGR
jgi:hypothetical protein